MTKNPQTTSIRFPRNDRPEFIKTLRARVNDYFTENNISRNANGQMIFKTIFMIALYGVPYLLMVTGAVTAPLAIYGLWVVMGIGVAGIGLSIMHDANHGSYSKNPTVNKMLGLLLNLVGGHALNWRIQHNVLHHSFTNIHGHDEDITPGPVMRFSPHDKHYKLHKFQHFYAWFFYGLMTFSWVTVKDFKQLIRYKNKGLLKGEKESFGRLMFELTISKIVYYAYILVIPMLVIDVAWWQILLGFFTMHFLAGLLLGLVFQPAHVMPGSEYPLPDPGGMVENNWAIHQLYTTMNFAPTNKILSWYVGGLNYQVEHHLFPNICHVHYKKIAPIVKQTAEEFGLPYHSQRTFRQAILLHAKMLRELGRGPEMSAS